MQELRESVQLLLSTKIAVYLMTFLIVTVAWAAHIRSDLTVAVIVTRSSNSNVPAHCARLPLSHRLFQVIVRIDDCLALLNLVKSKDDIIIIRL